jgi:anti-sigma B factor antagonist
MTSGLSIEMIRAGAELAVSGRLDGHSAPAARAALQVTIDDGAGDVVLHIPDLEIWDASGLGVLVGAQRRARQAGRRLVLADVSARQLRLLRATRLHRMLGVQPDVTAAADPALAESPAGLPGVARASS